jgi:RNA polymerase sigma-70 factor, ECF subfamily
VPDGPRKMAAASDDDLVAGAMLGDMPAYDELVRRYRAGVVAVARDVLGDREAAEDIAQETFLLAFRALPQLREPSRFAGWLHTIARHRARRVAARDSRCQPTEPSTLDRLVLANSRELCTPAMDATCPGAGTAELMAAMNAMPSDHRSVVKLHHLEGWPVARISSFLMLPVSTVKWRLHRGRRILCRLLAQGEENTEDG